MLALLRVPLESIINGIIFFLESAPDAKPKKPVSKGPPEIRYLPAKKEASVCLFLYSFLVYTYDFYKKDQKAEDIIKSLKLIWPGLGSLFK